LLALAEAKANTSQQEVLALVIDRETSAEVSRVNNIIGRSIYHQHSFQRWHRTPEQRRLWNEFEKIYDQGKARSASGEDISYEHLLIEYTQLKLYLHDLRKSCYYRGDPYCEREDIDVKGILDRCDELRLIIKEKRRVIRFAAWGGMEPQKATAYDKPLLYAFDEHTCSHIINEEMSRASWANFGVDLEASPTEYCPLKGEHWYHGNPYCRAHLGEARRAFKLAKRAKRQRWVCTKEPGCQRKQPHVHEFGSIDYL
jgi:hypothetical protein